MDVLVVGGGGREHALVWALSRSASVDKIYCAPGNAGIARIAECWDLRPGDLQSLALTADEHAVDLVVVGPEAPLASGIAEVFDGVGIPCFGPRKPAAIIEGSKAFAKAFMQRHGIPTAGFQVFHDPQKALSFAQHPDWDFPIVVKADGLAAGKGVLICETAAEAEAAVRGMMTEGTFGAAGSTVVVEEFLTGTEVTIMALSSGDAVLPLVPSQDHKQAFDGDRGPNTGGMGAYAPAYRVADPDLVARVSAEVLEPTVRGLAEEDRRFAGVLYAGLMLTDAGPRVLEYNCRFGDPEAQAVIPLIEGDFGELLATIAEGTSPGPIQWSERHCACVVVASEGYPGKYRRGDAIVGLNAAEARDDVIVFHSGTGLERDELITTGGRVLGVSALGDTLDAALDLAYRAVGDIRFPGMHYRRDIGRREVKIV